MDEQASRSDRFDPRTIRHPATVEEGEAAIRMCDRHVKSIEAQLAAPRRALGQEWAERAEGAKRMWLDTLERVTYQTERLRAGEGPVAELRALRRELAAERDHAAALEKRLAAQSAQIRAEQEANRRKRASGALEAPESLRKIWEEALRAERALLQRSIPGAYLKRTAKMVPMVFRDAWNAEQVKLGYTSARSSQEIVPDESPLGLLVAELVASGACDATAMAPIGSEE